MKIIKIGRKEYEILPGDYILYNGATYLFCSGDRRVLKYKDWQRYRQIRIPQSVLKSINLSEMRSVKSVGCTYYYF